MRDWLIRNTQRAALAAAVLFAIGFGGAYLLGQGLRSADLEPASIDKPLTFGIGLAGVGFVLVFVFEAIGWAWGKVFGRSKPKSENTP